MLLRHGYPAPSRTVPVSQLIHKLKQHLQKPTTKLVVVGLHYSAHQFIEAAHKSGQYQVLAVVNNEPWLHKTNMLGAKVIYPVELPAFVVRNAINMVIDFEGTEQLLDSDIIKSLNNVKVTQIANHQTAQQALDMLNHGI